MLSPCNICPVCSCVYININAVDYWCLLWLFCCLDPPGAPKNVHVKEVNKDYVILGWEACENDGGSPIVQYIIEKRDVTRESSMWIVAGTVDPSDFKYRCTKLFTGNSYDFRVLGENRVGPGEPAGLKEPVIAKLPYGKDNLIGYIT